MFEEEQDQGGLEEHLWEEIPEIKERLDDEDEWEGDYIPKYGTKYNRKQKKDS